MDRMGKSASDDQWLAEYSSLKASPIFRSFDIWKLRALRFTSLVPNKQASICDFGAGEGRALMALERLGYSNLHALDTKNVLLESLKDRVDFVQGDISNLDMIADNSFDAAYVLEALHHLPDQETCSRSLKEINRTIKSGGMLFLYEPVHNLPTRIHYTLIRRKCLHFIPMLKTMATLLEMEKRELFRFYEYMDTISSILGRLGFDVVSERNFLNHRLWAARKTEPAGEASL
jgi:ubiquinone/menaquinone biosynthesis C-methylase UbiE